MRLITSRHISTCACVTDARRWLSSKRWGKLSGTVRARELAEALDWAADNRALLIAKWQELNP
ncbi:MAG: DUF4160 domain-containing protein [Xanthomonadales bacterium]|nr:DUF4160 domain-containing protein [Xanthomonadales bacterium]